MEKRWRMSRDCKEVLSMLLQSIEGKRKGKGNKRVREEGLGSPSATCGDVRSAAEHTTDGSQTPKRRMIHSPRMESRYPIDRQRSSQPGSFPSQRTRTPLPTSSQRNAPNNFAFNAAVGPSQDNTGGFHRHMLGYGGLSPNMGQQDFSLMGSVSDFQSSSHNFTSYFAPIPTTFPDRHRGPNNQQTDQLGGADNFFEIFDGATWGSLIDIVNDAGMGG